MLLVVDVVCHSRLLDGLAMAARACSKLRSELRSDLRSDLRSEPRSELRSDDLSTDERDAHARAAVMCLRFCGCWLIFVVLASLL